MKRTVIAAIAISVLLSPSALADTKSRAAKNVKAAAIKCAPTKASGHTPKDVAPAQKLPKKIARTFTFETNCGNIVITTVGAKAPITITQLSTLAKRGYFDNSLCHRLTTQGLYVLQCEIRRQLEVVDLTSPMAMKTYLPKLSITIQLEQLQWLTQVQEQMEANSS